MRGEEESTSSQTEPLGNDIDLLAEIITRLKETAAEIGRDLAPREFAAMSATLYKRIQEDRDLKTRSVRISAIKPQIYDLLEYEALRHKRSKQ